jgi:hypothetical protein
MWNEVGRRKKLDQRIVEAYDECKFTKILFTRNVLDHKMVLENGGANVDSYELLFEFMNVLVYFMHTQF